jgi:pheromone shutdown protein TraB
MIAMAGFTSGHVSLLVFFLFLLNSLLASSTGSSSPDGRIPSSPPPPLPLPSSSSLPSSLSSSSSSLPPLRPSLSSQNINLEVIEASNEYSVGNVTSVTTTNGRTQNSNIPLWKQQLPFPLNNKTKTLQRILIPGGGHPEGEDAFSTGSDVEVFLLGTAHISKDSSRDVRQLLESVEPDAIFLELCHQRLNLLEPSDNDDIDVDTHQQQHETDEDDTSNNKSNTTGGFWNQCRGLFRRGQNSRAKKKKEKTSDEKRIDTRSFSSIASSLMSNMQGNYADSLGVELGGEFRAAYQYWKTVVPHGIGSYRKVNRIHNVHMILGDRPVTLTLTRAWESLRIWGKIKLMVGLLVSSLRKPNPDELREWMENILYGDTDLMSESVTELAKHFPTLAEVILKERDAYMACKLHQTCRRLLIADSRHNRSNRRYRLVAIVGAGHVEGICRWLTTGGSVTTISTVARTTASSSSSSKTAKDIDISQQPPESPEDILSKLIQIKATIPQEDHDYLVHQITELDPELLNEISEIVEE